MYPGRVVDRGIQLKSSSSGNRTPGVCVTGRNVTNYTNEEYSLGDDDRKVTRAGVKVPSHPNIYLGCLAQWPEHEIADLAVTGSNPVVP